MCPNNQGIESPIHAAKRVIEQCLATNSTLAVTARMENITDVPIAYSKRLICDTNTHGKESTKAEINGSAILAINAGMNARLLSPHRRRLDKEAHEAVLKLSVFIARFRMNNRGLRLIIRKGCLLNGGKDRKCPIDNESHINGLGCDVEIYGHSKEWSSRLLAKWFPIVVERDKWVHIGVTEASKF